MDALRQCTAVILTDDLDRVLLLWQPRRKYGLPGGIVEPQETPPLAAVREAREEIGVEVALEYHVGSYHLRGGGVMDMFNSVYKARIVSGEPHVADLHEVLGLEWFERGRLPSPILNDARVAIPDFWAGKRGVVTEVWRDGVVLWTG
jgi:8-oxo-dGTP diphosphatase